MARNRIASSSTELFPLNPQSNTKHYDDIDPDDNISVSTFTHSVLTAEMDTERESGNASANKQEATGQINNDLGQISPENQVKPVESDKSLKSWASSSPSTQSRPRAKSYSSFGRLTSFMAGSPRPPFKYYHQHASTRKKANLKSKFGSEASKKACNTKTEALIEKYLKARNRGGNDVTNGNDDEEDVEDDVDKDEEEDDDESRTRPISVASVEGAARLALAARAKYSKGKSSKCLEKAAFFIVMDDKFKSDSHSKKASPGQIADAESILLEEIQRQADEKNRLTPISKSRIKSARSRSRQSKSRHHHHHHDSKARLSVASKSSDQDIVSPSDSIPSKSSATFDGHIPSSAITPTEHNDLFRLALGASSTPLTAASTTINTPEDFLTTNDSCSFETLNNKSPSPYPQPVDVITKMSRKPHKKSHKKSGTTNSSSRCSSSGSMFERKKETISKLNHAVTHSGKSSRLSHVDRLSSTVSSVFGQNDSSVLLDPFTPQVNPITTTSANSKPVSPLSLVIAGLVMLSGTCAFLVSFALGRNGPWTLAASVVMGFGAVAVFSGLCWYLAHTSAPAADQTKIRLFSGAGHPSGVEIKVVDRKELDDLIKRGACVQTINAVNVV